MLVSYQPWLTTTLISWSTHPLLGSTNQRYILKAFCSRREQKMVWKTKKSLKRTSRRMLMASQGSKTESHASSVCPSKGSIPSQWTEECSRKEEQRRWLRKTPSNLETRSLEFTVLSFLSFLATSQISFTGLCRSLTTSLQDASLKTCCSSSTSTGPIWTMLNSLTALDLRPQSILSRPFMNQRNPSSISPTRSNWRTTGKTQQKLGIQNWLTAGSLISNGQRRRATSDATDLIELTEPWTKSSRTLEIETISRLREKSRWKKRSSSKHQDLSKWTSLLN